MEATAMRQRFEAIEARLAAIEQALAGAGVVGTPLPAAPSEPLGYAEARALVEAGDSMKAIKVLREKSGLDLRQCKMVVEEMGG